MQYRIPESLRPLLAGRRVLLADDAVNAGSALRATLAELLNYQIILAGFASLLVLGETVRQIAGQYQAPFFSLATVERGLWTAEACPLCRAGLPLIDHLKQS